MPTPHDRRQEIYGVLFHQEGLLQIYRTSLFTIQSLLFAAYIALLNGLETFLANPGEYRKMDAFRLFVQSGVGHTVVVGLVLAIVALVVLKKMKGLLAVRERNVYLCQDLLCLDEMGQLQVLWEKHLSVGTFEPGMQWVLRLNERGAIPNIFGSPDLAAVRSALPGDASRRQGSTRWFFVRDIFNYFYALWFSGLIAGLLSLSQLLNKTVGCV